MRLLASWGVPLGSAQEAGSCKQGRLKRERERSAVMRGRHSRKRPGGAEPWPCSLSLLAWVSPPAHLLEHVASRGSERQPEEDDAERDREGACVQHRGWVLCLKGGGFGRRDNSGWEENPLHGAVGRLWTQYKSKEYEVPRYTGDAASKHHTRAGGAACRRSLLAAVSQKPHPGDSFYRFDVTPSIIALVFQEPWPQRR